MFTFHKRLSSQRGFDFEWQVEDLLQNCDYPWTHTMTGPGLPEFLQPASHKMMHLNMGNIFHSVDKKWLLQASLWDVRNGVLYLFSRVAMSYKWKVQGLQYACFYTVF